MWLLAFFIAVPIIEIALFIQVGGLIGLWPTLAIVIVTAVAGTALVRTQGLATLQRLRENLARGSDPVGPIAHGALILVAGVLLLTPGFFTDAVGLALLVPPVRQRLIAWASAHMTVIAAAEVRRGGVSQGGPVVGGETLEAEYEVVAEEAPRDRGARPESGWTRPPG